MGCPVVIIIVMKERMCVYYIRVSVYVISERGLVPIVIVVAVGYNSFAFETRERFFKISA